jgi:hypothetical protein
VPAAQEGQQQHQQLLHLLAEGASGCSVCTVVEQQPGNTAHTSLELQQAAAGTPRDSKAVNVLNYTAKQPRHTKQLHAQAVANMGPQQQGR